MGGGDVAEIVYSDIYDMKFIYRWGGSVGDLVIFLRDGAKLEIRSLAEFPENYSYIMSQLPEDVQAECQQLKTKE